MSLVSRTNIMYIVGFLQEKYCISHRSTSSFLACRPASWLGKKQTRSAHVQGYSRLLPIHTITNEKICSGLSIEHRQSLSDISWQGHQCDPLTGSTDHSAGGHAGSQTESFWNSNSANCTILDCGRKLETGVFQGNLQNMGQHGNSEPRE